MLFFSEHCYHMLSLYGDHLLKLTLLSASNINLQSKFLVLFCTCIFYKAYASIKLSPVMLYSPFSWGWCVVWDVFEATKLTSQDSDLLYERFTAVWTVYGVEKLIGQDCSSPEQPSKHFAVRGGRNWSNWSLFRLRNGSKPYGFLVDIQFFLLEVKWFNVSLLIMTERSTGAFELVNQAMLLAMTNLWLPCSLIPSD
jgi:hypothetical protein